MRQELITFAFAAVIFLLFIWRVRGGFACGMMQELVNVLSGGCALVCVVLIFIAVSSVVNRSMHIFTVCIVALILLGICFKICRLIFTPLLAVGNISIVSGINKLLGAVLGAGEVCVLAFLLYKVFEYYGIYLF